MRTDDERRIPVPFVVVLTAFGVRHNKNAFLCAAVIARETAVLVLSVEDIGIGRIELWLVAIATEHDVPVGIRNAMNDGRSRGRAERIVVLGTAAHIVEGLRVVRLNAVELRDREISHVSPCRTAVPAFVNAAVAADIEVFRVFRIDPQCMIVDVTPLQGQRCKRLAAVLRLVCKRVQRVDAIRVEWIDDEFIVVLRAVRHV